MAVLCDSCWNRLANGLAEDEGATAPPMPEFGPDDVSWVEPATCEQCGAPVRVRPTNYDRWVSLATVELPAKDVPPHHRWRVVRVYAPRTGVVVDLVAVRVRAVDPLPGDPVVPAHRMLCVQDGDEE
ncbi:DUF6083 domain-containing protein [Streptomyces sp. NPDC046712]|uniref:DUF6083 domain-containing protein n=1 Tax=Streptomyces sp. NPDC046712 TaxID=3154802 RepID=UPI0033F96F5B